MHDTVSPLPYQSQPSVTQNAQSRFRPMQFSVLGSYSLSDEHFLGWLHCFGDLGDVCHVVFFSCCMNMWYFILFCTLLAKFDACTSLTILFESNMGFSRKCIP